jgi:hypothetical protein
MTDEQIKDEAIKYCNALDFTGDKGLNEKGRDRVREWCQQDFIAGANWMREQKQIKISSNSVLSDSLVAYQKWCYEHPEYDQVTETPKVELYLKATNVR